MQESAEEANDGGTAVVLNNKIIIYRVKFKFEMSFSNERCIKSRMLYSTQATKSSRMFTKYEQIAHNTNKRKLDILCQKAHHKSQVIKPFTISAQENNSLEFNSQLNCICDEIGKLRISVDSSASPTKEKICSKIIRLKESKSITKI